MRGNSASLKRQVQQARNSPRQWLPVPWSVQSTKWSKSARNWCAEVKFLYRLAYPSGRTGRWPGAMASNTLSTKKFSTSSSHQHNVFGCTGGSESALKKDMDNAQQKSQPCLLFITKKATNLQKPCASLGRPQKIRRSVLVIAKARFILPAHCSLSAAYRRRTSRRSGSSSCSNEAGYGGL